MEKAIDRHTGRWTEKERERDRHSNGERKVERKRE